MLKPLFSMALFCITYFSYGADFIAGKDYETLNNPHALTTDKAITVSEFFSYGCPWCYRLEPALLHWIKQKNSTIRFKRIPVVFNKNWEYYAKAYYAAEALSLSSTIHPALFKAILTDKQTLNNEQAMIDFFIHHGVTPETAQSAFRHSPSIELSIQEGLTQMGRDHIDAIPAFVVNNHFKTDVQMAKTEKRLFEILDFLIAQSTTHQ
jgi:thiol:disulfide interchange protein DsbA